MGHPPGEDLGRCFDLWFLEVSGCHRAQTGNGDGVGVTIVCFFILPSRCFPSGHIELSSLTLSPRGWGGGSGEASWGRAWKTLICPTLESLEGGERAGLPFSSPAWFWAPPPQPHLRG